MRNIGLKAIAITACLALLVPAVFAGQSSEEETTYYPYKFARLNYVNGDVFVQRTGDLGMEKGEINLALVQGDILGTGEGRAEVRFGKRNTVRIDMNGKVEFAGLPEGAEEPVKLHLNEGRIYLRIENLEFDKAVEVHTPDASFYVLDAGLYRFDVEPGNGTTASTVEGELEAAGEDGSEVLGAGESLTASDGRFVNGRERRGMLSDAFAEWNGSREALYARKSTRSYLPSGLDEYQEELEDNGRWVYENPYGYVWVPYAGVNDWRPYLMGRWVWYPVIGWTWVSSEPWGWAVYHYGRWHWRGGLGWYWIPRHEWRPAWVHWWSDGDYVGWCPLSWYNRPVVIIHNSFYDRYHERDFPIGNRGMTVIRRDGLRGRIDGRHVVQAPELRHIGRISLGARQPGMMRPSPSAIGLDRTRADQVFGRRGGNMDRPGAGGISRTWPAGKTGIAAPGKPSSGRIGSPGTAGSPSRGTMYPSRLSQGRDGERPSMERPSGQRAIRTYPSSGRADRQLGEVRSGTRSGIGSGNKPRMTTPPDPGVKERKITPRGEEKKGTVNPPAKREGGDEGRSKAGEKEKVKRYYSSSASISGRSDVSRSFSARSGTGTGVSARSGRGGYPASSGLTGRSLRPDNGGRNSTYPSYRPESGGRSASRGYQGPGITGQRSVRMPSIDSSGGSGPRSYDTARRSSSGQGGRSSMAPSRGHSSGSVSGGGRSGVSSSSGSGASRAPSSARSSGRSEGSGGIRKKG